MARFFNKNLKFIRQSKNISQQELADKLNIDRSTISRWENDEMDITVGNAIKLSNYFNIPIEDFAGKDLENTFGDRLQTALNLKLITPIQLSEKTGIEISNISAYLLGKLKPSTINIKKIAEAINVSESWLRGFDELDLLYNKYKHILTESDKAIIKTIIEQRIKEKGGE